MKRMTAILAPLAFLIGSATAAPPPKSAGTGTEAEFIATMQGLAKKHKMAPMARFDSKRFIEISNAEDGFSRDRLKLCEIFHDVFLRHFAGKGFTVHPPEERMMIAAFATNDNFDAYFGRSMTGIAGVYHTPANRLVLYDYAQNNELKRQRDIVASARARYEESAERKMNDFSKDMNLSVTMHECAHLVSFNCGLLSRHRDVPGWLVEGMATYSEATDQGDWTRLGSPNPMRIRDLSRAKGVYLSLAELVRDDRWLQSPRVLTGYAESWTLFHMLMTERTADLRRYLDLIRERRAPESRVADFQEAFGDIRKMQTRFDKYVHDRIADSTPLAQR